MWETAVLLPYFMINQFEQVCLLFMIIFNWASEIIFNVFGIALFLNHALYTFKKGFQGN